jgi:hypothetical protein
MCKHFVFSDPKVGGTNTRIRIRISDKTLRNRNIGMNKYRCVCVCYVFIFRCKTFLKNKVYLLTFHDYSIYHLLFILTRTPKSELNVQCSQSLTAGLLCGVLSVPDGAIVKTTFRTVDTILSGK